MRRFLKFVCILGAHQMMQAICVTVNICTIVLGYRLVSPQWSFMVGENQACLVFHCANLQDIGCCQHLQ